MMEFLVKSGHPHKQRTPALVLGLFNGKKLTPAAQEIDKAAKGELSRILRRGDIEGDIGDSLLLYDLPGCLADRVLIIGCGKERELTTTRYIDIQCHLSLVLQKSGIVEAVSYLTQLPVKHRDCYWLIRFAVEAISHAEYQYTEFKKSSRSKPKCKRLILTIPSRAELPQAEKALQQGHAIAEATHFCRDLGNTPPNVCDPGYLVQQALTLTKKFNSLQATILDEAKLEQEAMHSLLAVGRGSAKPSYLIQLSYQGGSKKTSPIVLVGKGVTFDTGGLNLKPYQSMLNMKTDMCGSASVLAVMQAVAQLSLPINVIGLVPTVENMPGSDAYRPSDIITTKSGQTVEVLNTDAEGRMILCDALTYAERFKPSAVIDIATLTGAIIVALGHEYSGLFGNHSPLVNELLKAGQQAQDEAWHLPMGENHYKLLNSNIADVKHIGDGSAASITAACFLSKFTEKYHWAHLDIAGVSRSKNGVTGRPISLLMQYLFHQADI